MAAEMAERIGARIKARREELGLTQAGLAAEIAGKATGDQVSRWERGKHLPRNLDPIAVALKVDVSHFYAKEPDKSVTPEPFPEKDDARLARMEQRLAEHAQAVEKLLARQSAVLKRIESAIKREDQVRQLLAETAKQTDQASQEVLRRLEALQAVAPTAPEAPNTTAT